MTLPALDKTRAVLERGITEGLHLGAQVYVSRRGADGAFTSRDLVLGERAPGQPMEKETLNIWLSSTKPIAAVAVAQLWERELLELDDPVALHVPEFAAQGKGEITLRHVLTHTGGFRLLSFGWPEASWEEIIAKICAARPEPRWELGRTAGYHLGSSWFMLGEVIRRVDGRPFSRYVREEIFEPLGMDDSWVGMPEERFAAYGDRLGRMYGTEKAYEKGGEPLPRGWHRAPHAVGCAPGGNGYGPIRELGRFYEMMLDRGRAGTRRILSPQSVEALTTPHRVGLLDKTFKVPLDWGLGFICDSKHYQDGEDAGRIPYGYGRWASRRAFGHSGFQSSTGFADPEHGLVIAALTNGQPGEENNTERFRQVAEAIYEDLGLAPTATAATPIAARTSTT